MRAPTGCLGVAGAWAVLFAWLVIAKWPGALCWIAGAVAPVGAAVWALRRWEGKLLRRWMDDKCVECGYDLRGIGRTGRCPECGLPFEGVNPALERDSDEMSG